MKKTELYSLLWEACNKLRGGVEPARYKDYVLVLLFFKYVSDRYKGQPFAEFTVSKGASFDDLILAKGKPDVGERVDKIIQKFLEDNRLQGSLPDVSFNNPDELGSGKELVDKVSGLIAVFQNPAIDFKNNRASGDDIIGDAYEYFMMKFAQESGKSKGQFYTPSEVSRIIARLIGIGNIRQMPTKKWTLYDPAAGSGSLLIRAADEAPVDENGDSIVTIFGQEKDHATAGLAKMNLILHQKGTGEIKRGNTLVDPAFTDDFGELKKFDFIVMNPPFSDKSWSDGIKTSEDKYKRFDGYGIPPEKNGDYAWFLHVLKSLDSNGKAGIIMPHGILFRGNAEESTISDITRTVITGGTPSTARQEYYGGNIPWLSSTEIHQKRIKKPTTYITDLGLQNSSAKIAPERSVLIALAGQGKTRGTAAYLTRPMALNQSLAALVTNEKCNPEFLYYLIESMYLSLRELSSGDGGRGGLNKKLIKGVTVTIPVDVAEQEAIADTLTAMDEEIEELEIERDKIIQIREGAMDDLLTGRVRLSV